MSTHGTSVTIEDLLAEESFVRRLARHLTTDDATADDVVQETWTRALGQRPRTPQALRGWLRTIARNVALGTRREEARRRARDRHAARREAVPSAEAVVERLLVQRAVVDRVVALDEPYRTVVVLRFYENLAPREIARHLGVPVATVRTRLYRAIDRLRADLSGAAGGKLDARDWLPAIVAWFVPTGATAGTGTGAIMASGTTAGASASPSIGAGTAAGKKSIAWLAAVSSKNVAAALTVVTAILVALVLWLRWIGTPPAPTDAPAAASAADTDDEIERLPVASVRRDDPRAETPPVEPAPARSGFGSLLLRTVHEDDRSPAGLIGLHVYAESPDRKSSDTEEIDVTTDKDGVARIESVRAGRVQVRTHRYQLQEVEVRSDEVTEVEIAIERGIDVRGIVVDDAGAPVGGAVVLLSTPGVRGIAPFEIALTRADGTFLVRCLSGMHGIGARADGYAPSALHPAAHLEAVDGTERFVRIVLGVRGGEIEGRVRDPDGAPVADARVVLGPVIREPARRTPEGTWIHAAPAVRTRTDSEGRFVVRCTEPGVNHVRVSAPGFAPWIDSVEVSALGVSTVDAWLDPGCVVEGRCTDDVGRPLADVTVRASYATPRWELALDHWARTGEDGTYRIVDLPGGALGIEAEDRDRHRVESEIALAAGETARWDPVLPAASLAIVGRLLTDTEEPLAGWWIRAIDRESAHRPIDRSAAFTGEDGRFRIPVKQLHEYRLSLHPGFPDLPLPGAWFASPGDAEIVIRLSAADRPRAEVRGRVVDHVGEPVVEAEVSLYLEDGDYPVPKNARPDPATGRFVLASLPGGRFVVVVSAPKRPPLAHDAFDLAPGERLDLGDLVFEPAGRLIVRVDRSALPAAPEPRLTFAPLGEESVRSFARDPDGSWITPYLENGPHVVQIRGRRVAAERVTVDVESGTDREIEIRPSPGAPYRVRFLDRSTEDASRSLRITVREIGGDVRYDAGPTARQVDEHSSDFTLDLALPAGRFEIVATSDTGRRAEHRLRVSQDDIHESEEGHVREIDLELR